MGPKRLTTPLSSIAGIEPSTLEKRPALPAGEAKCAIFIHAYKDPRPLPQLPWRWPPPGERTIYAQSPSDQRNRRSLEPQRRGPGCGRPHRALELPTRRERLLAGRAAPPAAQGELQAAPARAREGRGARHVARRRRRARDEGVGARAGRHPLHARLPAADRADRREARLLLRPRRRRRRAGRVLRQGADPGRAGRLVVPDRWRARDFRGARLHRLGPDQPGVHPREPQRRAAVHPDGVRVVDGRGARQQDPAAALDGRAVALGDPRAAAARRRPGARACSRPSGPSRSTS